MYNLQKFIVFSLLYNTLLENYLNMHLVIDVNLFCLSKSNKMLYGIYLHVVRYVLICHRRLLHALQAHGLHTPGKHSRSLSSNLIMNCNLPNPKRFMKFVYVNRRLQHFYLLLLCNLS